MSEHFAIKVTRFAVISPGKMGNSETFVDLPNLIDEPADSNAYTGPEGLTIDLNGRGFICQNVAGRVIVTDESWQFLNVINFSAK